MEYGTISFGRGWGMETCFQSVNLNGYHIFKIVV